MRLQAGVVLSSLHPFCVKAQHQAERACVSLVSNQEEAMPRCQRLGTHLTHHYQTDSNIINVSTAQVSTFWSKRQKPNT